MEEDIKALLALKTMGTEYYLGINLDLPLSDEKAARLKRKRSGVRGMMGTFYMMGGKLPVRVTTPQYHTSASFSLWCMKEDYDKFVSFCEQIVVIDCYIYPNPEIVFCDQRLLYPLGQH